MKDGRGFMETDDYHESRRIGALSWVWFSFGAAEYKSLLVEFAIGKKPVVRSAKRFQSFLFPEL